MGTKEYSVTVWSEQNGRGCSDQRWHGSNLDEALMVAAYEFGKEIVLAEYKEKKIRKKDTRFHRVNMTYAPKVLCHITVLEEIDSRAEAGGQSPKIIRSYGNESNKIFQRVHFD